MTQINDKWITDMVINYIVIRVFNLNNIKACLSLKKQIIDEK